MKTKKQTATTPISSKVSFIGLYSNVARAYEICAVGGHTMCFAYYSDPNDYERSVNPEDIRLTHEFFGAGGNIVAGGDKGDLIIDFVRPDVDTLLSCMSRKHETLEEINARIDEAQRRTAPDLSTMSPACFQLFKHAYDRLGMGVYETEIVFNVAQTIARMAGTNAIKVEHIAEAIQYRAIQRNETTKLYTFSE